MSYEKSCKLKGASTSRRSSRIEKASIWFCGFVGKADEEALEKREGRETRGRGRFGSSSQAPSHTHTLAPSDLPPACGSLGPRQ